MKNAKTYERKIKKLLSGMKKAAPVELPEDGECIAIILEAILLADGTDPRHANRSISNFTSVFVDFNELRVAPEKEIAECIDKNVPNGVAKAAAISVVLNAIFTASNTLDVAYIRAKSNRDIRRYLQELGLANFAEAYVARFVFDVHAIPVDRTLTEVLDMNEMIYPGSATDDTQGFLERVIPQKNNVAAHKFFRQYITKNAAALTARRKAEAKRLAAEQAKQRAEEEAKKSAEAEKKRKAEERQAAIAAKAANKAKAAKKAAKKTTKKKTIRKAAKKTVKKTVRKAVKKAVRKTAKKTKAKKK